jgi:hypothetical protein
MTNMRIGDLEKTRAAFRATVERQKEIAKTSSQAAPQATTLTPVVAYTKASEGHGKALPNAATPSRTSRPSIRLTDEDQARIREVIRHALGLNETLNTTEVLRLALHKWDFKSLNTTDIVAIRAQDGRRINANDRQT